jgi:hypothetical protein
VLAPLDDCAKIALFLPLVQTPSREQTITRQKLPFKSGFEVRALFSSHHVHRARYEPTGANALTSSIATAH